MTVVGGKGRLSEKLMLNASCYSTSAAASITTDCWLDLKLEEFTVSTPRDLLCRFYIGFDCISTSRSGLAPFVSVTCPNIGEYSISKSPSCFYSSISTSIYTYSTCLLSASCFYNASAIITSYTTTIWSFDSSC